MNLYGFVGNNGVNAWDVLGTYKYYECTWGGHTDITLAPIGALPAKRISERQEGSGTGATQALAAAEAMRELVKAQSEYLKGATLPDPTTITKQTQDKDPKCDEVEKCGPPKPPEPPIQPPSGGNGGAIG